MHDTYAELQRRQTPAWAILVVLAVACGAPDGENAIPSAFHSPSAGASASMQEDMGASGAQTMSDQGRGTASAAPISGGSSPEPASGAGANPVAGAGGSGNASMTAVPSASDGSPVCARYPARSDGLLLDFDTYDVIDGSWGDPGQSQLTGGTSPYSCADDDVTCPPTAVKARVRAGAGGLRIQAAIPSQGYTGMVLWFGPCVDASAFGGIELPLGGELFGAVLSVKLQTHENYPIDLVNVKGGCEFTSEADKWSECVPASRELRSMTPEPSPMRFAWSDFQDGTPHPSVSPDGLVGIELQFQCPSDVDCAMDVRIGALRLTPLD